MLPDTPNPKIIYDFIGAYWKEHGYAPSTKEIANHVHLTVGGMRLYLVELRSWGAIDWKPHSERTIRITGEYRRG